MAALPVSPLFTMYESLYEVDNAFQTQAVLNPALSLSEPFEVFGASLVAQKVRNPPVIQETGIQSLGWEDPPEAGLTTHSGLLAWRFPWTEELHGSSPWGHPESDTAEQLTALRSSVYICVAFGMGRNVNSLDSLWFSLHVHEASAITLLSPTMTVSSDQWNCLILLVCPLLRSSFLPNMPL